MTVEALWYSSYRDGEPPLCRRLSRLPMSQQFDLTIDLAISFRTGIAGYRKVRLWLTNEEYWYWPHPLSETGWWIIPDRVGQRVSRLVERAEAEAFRSRTQVHSEQVVGILRRWKRTGAWKHHVTDVIPRHGTPSTLEKALRAHEPKPKTGRKRKA